jgi:hypothetical protein
MVRRKKQSVTFGLHARAHALSPPDEGRLREIVEEIVDHLRPWKDRKDNDEVTAEVNSELRLVLRSAPSEAASFDRTQIRTHARQLDDALLNLEMSLAAPTWDLLYFLFVSQAPVTMSEDGVLMTADGVPMPTLLPSMEDILNARYEREDVFRAELNRLRKMCARAVDTGFGLHPNFDRVKRLSASTAHDLMRALSNRKITGTKDDAFRAIASLLYEAISGQRDADLKRACDSVLRAPS